MTVTYSRLAAPGAWVLSLNLWGRTGSSETRQLPMSLDLKLSGLWSFFRLLTEHLELTFMKSLTTEGSSAC